MSDIQINSVERFRLGIHGRSLQFSNSRKGRRMSRACACMMIAAAALVLSACSTTLQVYSSPEHETLRLRQGDLRDGGLAFLTPSTVTGQEEDKQSLAHVFAATLQSERPELRFVSLSCSRAVGAAGASSA